MFIAKGSQLILYFYFFLRILHISKKASEKKRLGLEEIKGANTLKQINELLLHVQNPNKSYGIESKFAEALILKRTKLLLNGQGQCKHLELVNDLTNINNWQVVKRDRGKPEFCLLFGELYMSQRFFPCAFDTAKRGLDLITKAEADTFYNSSFDKGKAQKLAKIKTDLLNLKARAEFGAYDSDEDEEITVTPEPEVARAKKYLRTENTASPNIVYPLSQSGRNVYRTYCDKLLLPGEIIAKGQYQSVVRFPEARLGTKVCHHCLNFIHDFLKPCLTCSMVVYCSNSCYITSKLYHE